jgi:hypothetical protein
MLCKVDFKHCRWSELLPPLDLNGICWSVGEVNWRALGRIPNGPRLTMGFARCIVSTKDADADLLSRQGKGVGDPDWDGVSTDADLARLGGAPPLDLRWPECIRGGCGRRGIMGTVTSSFLNGDDLSAILSRRKSWEGAHVR